jgi:elongator complex protein 5
VILGRLDHVKGIDKSAEGIVLEMEHRRKSGRGVVEWYVLPLA